MVEASKNEPRWRETTKYMLHAWNEGINSLQHTKSAQVIGPIEKLLDEEGFSGMRKHTEDKVSYGRSELLGGRKKR